MTSSRATFFTYLSPVGIFTIASNGTALTNIIFGEGVFPGENRPCELTNRAANQLQEYFAGKRTVFELPLEPQGSEFQKQVWEALRSIPYGETRSYGDIARSIDKPKAHRAVGSANNKNPLLIVVPCHRVIGANGRLSGYAAGTRLKEHLLTLEQAI